MKFKNIAEAYGFYKTKTVAELEKRAADIKSTIETDAKADVDALNVEIAGINQAMTELRSATGSNEPMNLLTGANFETRGSYEATQGDVFASAEYRNAFYKSLLGQDLNTVEKAAFDRAMTQSEKRASAFNTVSNSAAIIPTQTLNEIVKKAHNMGGIMGISRSFAMPSNIAIPVGTPGTKAAWHTEGAAVDTEKNVPTTVTFAGYEIIKIFSLSAATKTMSIAAFEAYLVEELTACVMECIADAMVNGTGSNQGTGVVSGITWTEGTNLLTVSKTGTLSYKDVAKVVSMLKRGYANGAKWVMNNATLYNTFYGMVDANGRPIFITDPKGESIGKILGFEVVIDDFMANDDFIFGNFNYNGYNMPQGIIVEVSRESSFKSGLIDYRALAIADCKPIVSEAFVKGTKATA